MVIKLLELQCDLFTELPIADGIGVVVDRHGISSVVLVFVVIVSLVQVGFFFVWLNLRCLRLDGWRNPNSLIAE